ncbi:erg26, C-3 sterol dehydrogenase [Hypocenomyce scalaris]|nr:erg26, C-3 sterol dehydrogenase [Hypocenomyce scalaris]
MAAPRDPNFLGCVLVIGGCGFVGHHIVSQLLESYSAQISVLDLHTHRNRFPSVSYHDGDISNSSVVSAIFSSVKPDIVIHTASPAHDASKAMLNKVNIEGTRNLVEWAGELGTVKAFVYTSSASVIHDNVSDLVNADERWPVLRAPAQREYYAEAKGIAEKIVLDANRKYGKMLTVSIRPAGIFGEGDVQMIPRMLKAYEQGQTKFQLGGNANLFDLTYVGNVAHAHILAALALMKTYNLSTTPLDYERVDGEAFFITNDSPVYFWDFPRMVWKAVGDKTEPKDVWTIQKDTGLMIATLVEWAFWLAGGRTPNLTRKAVNFSSMTRYYNIDKAKKRLGYKPLVGMEEGVERATAWFREQRQGNSAEKKVQ